MIYQGGALSVLSGLDSESIDMCMTSPPYWGLRDYGHENQLGLESTPELYIEHMTAIFHKVKRVLKKEATLWLNIGDTYNNNPSNSKDSNLGNAQALSQIGRQNRQQNSLLPKCLCMIPERLAWSLIQDGWILRNKIIWYKPNGMPSSVKDRFSNKWEIIYMFNKNSKAILWQHKETGEWVYEQPLGTKGKEGVDWKWKEDKKISLWHGFTYYFDLDAVREQFNYPERTYNPDTSKHITYKLKEDGNRTTGGLHDGRTQYGDPEVGKNPGDVEYNRQCGGNEFSRHYINDPRYAKHYHPEGINPGDFWDIPTQPFPEAHFAVFPERLCQKPIRAGCPKGGTVLDPFCGAGTVGVVAKELGRNFIGIDIKKEYCDMAEKRILKVGYQQELTL